MSPTADTDVSTSFWGGSVEGELMVGADGGFEVAINLERSLNVCSLRLKEPRDFGRGGGLILAALRRGGGGSCIAATGWHHFGVIYYKTSFQINISHLCDIIHDNKATSHSKQRLPHAPVQAQQSPCHPPAHCPPVQHPPAIQ